MGAKQNNSRTGKSMQTKPLSLSWQGTFIELCASRVSQANQAQIDAALTDSAIELQSAWYDNASLLKSLFGADNWWSVDDLDHAMGLVFADRPLLEDRLSTIRYTLAGVPVTVDPDALQLSFYAPEAMQGRLAVDEQILCHGALRQTEIHLEADIEPPFDPSLFTLSFLHYPDYGFILIDMDYDGHDDLRFTWGETAYLKPRFFEKDHFDDTAT
jgi:hypothetical protein